MHTNKSICTAKTLSWRSRASVCRYRIAKEYNVAEDDVAAIDSEKLAETSGRSCDRVRVRFMAPNAMIK
jgi:hypothetical protein